VSATEATAGILSVIYRLSLRRCARDHLEKDDISREECDGKKADLLIERDALEVPPGTASLAIQRQRITAIVEDCRR
jgi:hypothetical protein